MVAAGAPQRPGSNTANPGRMTSFLQLPYPVDEASFTDACKRLASVEDSFSRVSGGGGGGGGGDCSGDDSAGRRPSSGVGGGRSKSSGGGSPVGATVAPAELLMRSLGCLASFRCSLKWFVYAVSCVIGADLFLFSSSPLLCRPCPCIFLRLCLCCRLCYRLCYRLCCRLCCRLSPLAPLDLSPSLPFSPVLIYLSFGHQFFSRFSIPLKVAHPHATTNASYHLVIITSG